VAQKICRIARICAGMVDPRSRISMRQSFGSRPQLYYLLADQPEPPRYFAMMKHLNKVKRPLLIEVPKHPHLSNEQFLSAYRKAIKVIDARNKAEFARGFIPGSLNIQGNNSFST